MKMIHELESIVDALEEVIILTDQYRRRIHEDVEQVRAKAELSERVRHIWTWQLEAAERLMAILDDDISVELQRIVEQDFILRQPDVDRILI